MASQRVGYDITIRLVRRGDGPEDFQNLRDDLAQWIAAHAIAGEITMMESEPLAQETTQHFLDGV
jgi:hypothetical protein